METKPVSKAQALRDKQARESFNHKLRRELVVFENKYLMGSVRHAFRVIESDIKHTAKQIEGYPNREIKLNKWGREDGPTLQDLQYRLERRQFELSQDGTITLNAIVPAKKSYDEKIERLVNELVAEGFGDSKYTCETIRTVGGELEFLFVNSIKSLHARFIWVESTVVCDHFRFITTVRRS